MAVSSTLTGRVSGPAVRRQAGRRERIAANDVAINTAGRRAVASLAENGLVPVYASDALMMGGAMQEAHKLIGKLARGKNGEATRVQGLLEMASRDVGIQRLLGLLENPQTTVADIREAVLGYREIPTDSPPL